jgi:hypothetical protein
MENKTHQSSELHFKEYQENLEGKATCNHMGRHQLCQVLLLTLAVSAGECSMRRSNKTKFVQGPHRRKKRIGNWFDRRHSQ